MEDKQYKPMDEEITISEIYGFIKKALRSVISNMWIYLFFIVLGAAIASWLYRNEPVVFFASGNYMVIEGSGQSDGGLNSVLATFGVGSSSSGGTNLGKVLEISKSQKLIYPILLDSATINGERDLLVHFILKRLSENDLIGSDNIRLSTDSTDSSTRRNNLLLRIAHNHIVSTQNDVISMEHASDFTNGLINLSVSSVDEELAMNIYRKLFDSLEHFYSEKTLSRMARNYEKASKAVDSLRQRMIDLDASLARYADQSSRIILQRDRIRQQFLNRESTITSIQYGEAVKKLAIVSQIREQEEAVFQVLSEPLYPLASSKPSIYTYLLAGLAAGAFIGMALHGIVVVVRRVLFSK